MEVTSIFLLSLIIFYPIKERNHHFSNSWFVISKCFHFDLVQNFIIRWSVNSLLNRKILNKSELKTFVAGNLNVVEMIFLSLIELKTLWKKEKMLVTSIFSFSHSVFQSLPPPYHWKLGFCCKNFNHTCHNFFRKNPGQWTSFSGTEPPPPPPPPFFFFFSIIGRLLYYAMPKPNGAK